jgi:cyclase
MISRSLILALSAFVCVFIGCTDYGLNVDKIDENFYLVFGEGGNSGILVCDTAVLVIDTKMKTGAERLRRFVEKKAPNRRVYIVNTHAHKDHTSGNHLYANPVVIAGNYGMQFWNAVNAKEDMPTRWLDDTMTLEMGDETVLIENVGQAHSFNDVIVYLKDRKALFTGDIVLNGYHPFLDYHVGADVNSYIRVMDDLMFSKDCQWVIPGHGQMGDENLIRDFKEYFVRMREVAERPELEAGAREDFIEYKNLPVNKAGFEQTLKYIRESSSLRE